MMSSNVGKWNGPISHKVEEIVPVFHQAFQQCADFSLCNASALTRWPLWNRILGQACIHNGIISGIIFCQFRRRKCGFPSTFPHFSFLMYLEQKQFQLFRPRLSQIFRSIYQFPCKMRITKRMTSVRILKYAHQQSVSRIPV